VTLRAGCASLLRHGVLPRIENELPALRAREVCFRSHAREGTRRDPHSRLAARAPPCRDASQGRWKEVLREDAADEEAHRALMRRSAASGDRPAAVRPFRLLRDELSRVGAEPSEETLAHHDPVTSESPEDFIARKSRQ